MTESQLLDLIFAPWSMCALFAACRLRVFTLLTDRALSGAELAGRTRAASPILTTLLDACVGMGLLRLDRGLYSNSHISDAYLVEGRPRYLGDLIRVQVAEAADWQRLYNVITNTASEDVAAASQEGDPRQFTLAMHNIDMLSEAEALAAAVDLSAARRMVDVGCGSGMYSVAVTV